MFDFGANCNIPDYYGDTPLHYACDNFIYNDNRTELIRLYVDNGADINIRNSKGKTPFFVSCDGDDNDVVRFLISEIHVDVNIPDNEGNTPLHFACNKRNLELIRILLFEGNADENVRNNNGLTPTELVRFHMTNIRQIPDYHLEFDYYHSLDDLENQFKNVIGILESKNEIQDSASVDVLHDYYLKNPEDTPREQVLTYPDLTRNVKSYLSKPRSVYEGLLGPQLYNSFVRTARSLLRPRANASVVTRRSHSGKNSGKGKKGGKKTTKRKMKKTIKSKKSRK